MKYRDNSILLGKIFLITGILGIMLALGLLVATWIISPNLVKNTKNMLSSTSSILNSTNEGLSILKSSLETSASSLEAITTTIDSLSSSIIDMSSLSEKTSDIIGLNLQEILDDTQSSLESFGKGIKLVDDTLNILANITLLGLDYRPDIPLQTSLNNLAMDMSLLSDEFTDIESYLDVVSSDLTQLELSSQEIKTQVSKFSTQINDAVAVIDSYKTVIDQMLSKATNLQNNISGWIYGISALITLIMLWLILIQLLPFLRAYELIVGKQHYVNIHDIRNTSNKNNSTTSEEKNA